MLSDRLLKILEELEMTPYQLSKVTGKSRGNINNMLKGRIQNPRADFIELLKAKLNVNPDWILTNEGEMFLSENSTGTKDLSPEEKQDLIKKKFKEQFDITEKNYELIFDGLANNQEIIILFLKALNGDPIAKQFMKNMFHN